MDLHPVVQKGLAYVDEVPVNWCEALGTVLANEEVIDGKSERGGHPVVRKPMRQWVLKITEYAERLLEDLEELDWSESIKDMQRNWIGKSTGAEVVFAIEGSEEVIKVFTTRADTLFGASFAVLAPEHELVDAITTAEQREAIKAYQEQAARKSDLERTDLAKEKQAYSLVPMRSIRLMVQSCLSGLRIMCSQDTVQERLWQFQVMMDGTGNLRSSSVWTSLKLSRVGT